MPLELRPATEEDAARAAEIEHLAYASDPWGEILFPGPFPEDGDADGNPAGVRARAAELVDELREDPVTTRWFKVVDTDLLAPGSDNSGKGDKTAAAGTRIPGNEAMIAFARWHIYTADAPPRSTLRPFGPGCSEEACQMLFGGIEAQRRRLMGDRPYVCKSILTLFRVCGTHSSSLDMSYHFTSPFPSFIRSSIHRLCQI